jgi:hypothetical protein
MRVGDVTVERRRVEAGWDEHRPLRALVESDLRRVRTDSGLRCRSTHELALGDPYRADKVVLLVRRSKWRVGEDPGEQ